jgi:hypothetical protein
MIAVASTNGQVEPSRIEELTKQVSASRLGCWTSCRLKFYFKYVLQLEKSSTSALHAGKTVHAVLQAWNLARWRGQTRSEADLSDLFIQSWDEDQLGQEIDWDDEEAKQKEGAWKLLETYFRQTPIPPDEKPQAVEVRLESDLGQHGLPNLIGIIDLVRSPGTVVDFKTSAQSPNPDRVAHQTEIQLTCYAVLYREATGEQEMGFELHHLVKLKVPKLIVTPLAPVTDNQQTRLFRMMESYVEGVSREDFVPSPGIQCLSCQYFNECRRWS